MKECKKHEFNTGFVSALSKFLAHRDMNYYLPEENRKKGYDMRIYGASDHLFNIEIPKSVPKPLAKEIESFVSDVFKVRLSNLGNKDSDVYFEKCNELLMKIDKKCFGLKHVCENYP